MQRILRIAHSIFLAVAVIATGLAAGAEPSQPAAVQRMYNLFEQLRRDGPVSLQLTDDEINEYMTYALRTNPRPGLVSVRVKIFPHNYVSTFTVVDFDAVERWKPGTIPPLLRPALSGQRSVWVDFRLQANGGRATFRIEKAYFRNIRLPAFLVDKVIQIVAARQPEHYDTSKPLPIPFGLQQVWTQGHAVHGRR